MLAVLLGAAFLGGALPARGQGAELTSGTLRGTVYDEDFGVPLPRARVTIVELGLAALTSQDGTFLLERVPAGSYTVSFAKDGYERELQTGVSVSAGRLTDVRAELAAEIVELDELVVTGMDLVDNPEIELLEIRAASVIVQDAVSAELIKQAGASDVGGALKLVVGASVVDGKYATVRGLSDRYTGVTLNGVRVPSADPRRRAVQVDLFPTGTIENVVVSKTFMPDLQGDFTGGGIDIQNRSVPEGPVLAVSTSVEYNSLATGDPDVLTYREGGVPFTGFAGSERDAPPLVFETAPPFPRISINPSPENVEYAEYYDELTRSFVPVMGVSRDEVGPGYSWSIQGGDRYDIDAEGKFGLIGALTYSRKNEFYAGAENNQGGVNNPGAGIQLSREWEDSKGTQEVLIGALGSAAWVPNERHSLALRLAGNQSAIDEARFQTFQGEGSKVIEQNQSLVYTERSVASIQLSGRNQFARKGDGKDPAASSGPILDYVLSWNYTSQDEPDVRFFRSIFDTRIGIGGFPANSSDAQNTRRIFRAIEETNLQGSVNATFPFRSAGEEGSIKLGLYADGSDRDYTQRSFSFRFPRQVGSGPAVDENNSYASFFQEYPGQLWTDVFMESQRIGLAKNRCAVSDPPCAPAPNQLVWTLVPLGSDVDYTGDQEIGAAYGMATVPLSPATKLIGGVRRESTSLEIIPINPVLGTVEVIEVQPTGDRALIRVPQEEGVARIDDVEYLPAIGLVYSPAAMMNIRVSYAHTLARPTFRELAPVATEEFIFGDEFIGNPDLTLSSIRNYDLRWEWFPVPGRVLAVSLFYKELADPIEYISFGVANRSFVQPVNYEQGAVKGAELEARTDMAHVWDRLAGLVVGMNASWIESSVDLPEDEYDSLEPLGLAEDSRPLQGQPEYLLNLYTTWEQPDWGTSLGIFYNRIGRILVTGAARGVEDGAPTVFEEPYDALDLTAQQRFGERWSASFKGGNLLAPDRELTYETPDGITAVKSRRPTARTFSLGLSYKW